MKKIKKTDLRLEKEVIFRLSQDDLDVVKGGANTQTVFVENCSPVLTDPYCKTVNQTTCAVFLCQQTAVLATCPAKTDGGATCLITACKPCAASVNLCIQSVGNDAFNCNIHG